MNRFLEKRPLWRIGCCTLISIKSPLPFAVACGVLAIPWVSPLASGPSPSVQPWLVTLFVAGFALMVSCAGSLTREQLAVAAMGGVLLGASFNALAGMLQYAGSSDPFAPWISASSPGQAFGNLRQRNQYATLMLMGQAVVLGLSLRGTRWRWWLPALMFFCAGNAVSSSRTGALGLLLLTVLLLAWRGLHDRRVWALIACGLGAYLLVAIGAPVWLAAARGVEAPSLFARFTEAQGCGSRSLLWANVLHLIAQKPWLGWGWGELDYAHYITLYPGPRFCDILDNAHNLPLQFAVELGVPAALLACFAATRFVVVRAPWRETGVQRQVAWMLLAVIALHSLLEYPLWYGPFQLAFWACIAMVWRRPSQSNSSMERLPGRWVWRAGAGGALVAFALLAWWDYARVSQIYLPYAQRSPAYQDDTLMKIGRSWLFNDQLRFAELTTAAAPTRANAPRMEALASQLLHFSPEPRVVELLIESLVLLGRDEEALAHLARLRAAFPRAYEDFTCERIDGILPPGTGVTRRQNSPTCPRASPAASRP